MQARELQFHIQCLPGQVGRYCILPGDPGRCGEIAKYFDLVKKGDIVVAVASTGLEDANTLTIERV